MSEDAAPQGDAAPAEAASAADAINAPPAEPQAAPSADPAAPDAPWYASIEDPELRGLAENRKWDNPEKAVKSYRDLEKLRGVPEDRLLKLPSDLNDAEFREDLAKRLGRPDTPDGYEGVEEQWLKEAAHKLGLNPSQATALREAMGADTAAAMEKDSEAFKRQAELDMQDIRREWGQAYDEKLEDVRRFTKDSGFSAQEIQDIEAVIGTKKMMETFSRFGALADESSAVVGEMSADGVASMSRMTREAAAAKVAALNGDPEFQARLMHPDQAVRMAAVAERAKYSKLAHD